MCASTSEDRSREKKAETEGVHLSCPTLLSLTCSSENARSAVLTKPPLGDEKAVGFWPFLFNRDKPSRPWMRERERALNSHQVESRDVTSRHSFWANSARSQIKTPPPLHGDYESNNTVNKWVFRRQRKESLRIFLLSETLFERGSCLPSNMWQEFKKRGGACCAVRRRGFIWGYESGFGSAANFWHCSPLQPRPCRSSVCNTAVSETPTLATSFKTRQRGRASPGWTSASFADGVFRRGARKARYQRGALSL